MRIMKPAFTAILILSFLGVAVFGFLSMGHESGHNMELCLAKVFQNAPCEESGSLFASTYHARVFKSFSLTLLAALAVFAAFLFFIGRLPDTTLIFPDYSPEKISLKFVSPLRLEKLKWLALHKASPTSILTPA